MAHIIRIFVYMMQAEEILKKYWKYNAFRPLQKEIIQSVLSGKDTLALMPTGGGKSLCYQVPAMMKEGLCLVVSPLIALMKDQVALLKRLGIPAMAVFSGMDKKEIDIALDNCIYGNIKILYLSPERLTSDMARERIRKMKIRLLAVDEAHCISQWGYDFRPAYLEIAAIREWITEAPVLALTATATPEVVEDIQEKLRFRKKHVLRKSFMRDNLAYVVLQEEDKKKRLLRICNSLKGSGIVYVRNRKKTKEISDFLNQNKCSAIPYHAGMDMHTRDKHQRLWVNGKINIIVATNAFGMGIDKPDVRFVAHLDLPDSIESYFQEAGRAGRDGMKSWAVLLYSPADKLLMKRSFENHFPSIREIRKVYQALANYFQIAAGAGQSVSYGFDLGDFCNKYDMKPLSVYHCIQFIEKEGYISTTDALGMPPRIHFTVDKETLYRFQLKDEAMDSLIKVILRSYPGLMERYIAINESILAKRAGISPDELREKLKLMDRHKIISYLPQNELPQITYHSGRISVDQLNIHPDHYEELKKRALKRMKSIWHYADAKNHCRSKLLLAYFGEKQEDACGICDVCLEYEKNHLRKNEYAQLAAEISALLQKQALPIEAIVGRIRSREEKTLRVLRWMIDNRQLKYNTENKLTLLQ